MDEETMQGLLRTAFAQYRGANVSPCFLDEVYGPNPLDEDHIVIDAWETGGKAKVRMIHSVTVQQLAKDLVDRGVTAVEHTQLQAAVPQLSAFWDRALLEGAIA